MKNKIINEINKIVKMDIGYITSTNRLLAIIAKQLIKLSDLVEEMIKA